MYQKHPTPSFYWLIDPEFKSLNKYLDTFNLSAHERLAILTGQTTSADVLKNIQHHLYMSFRRWILIHPQGMCILMSRTPEDILLAAFRIMGANEEFFAHWARVETQTILSRRWNIHPLALKFVLKHNLCSHAQLIEAFFIERKHNHEDSAPFCNFLSPITVSTLTTYQRLGVPITGEHIEKMMACMLANAVHAKKTLSPERVDELRINLRKAFEVS